MNLGFSSFPIDVWNGIYPTNDDRLDDVSPNFFGLDRLTNEIVSIEQYLTDHVGLFDLFDYPGVVGSVISVDNSGTGLIYREIVAGPGIAVSLTGSQLIISSDAVFSAIVDENVIKGCPVYLKLNGHLGVASAIEENFRVAGLMRQNTLSGDPGLYLTEGKLELSNWTQITGEALLTPGAQYFLHPTVSGLLAQTRGLAALLHAPEAT
jgi:hypothetical protein